LPEMHSPFDSHSPSSIFPVAVSIPPRNDTGHEHTTALPDATPDLIFLACISVISPPGESWSA
jgi:hypothetical protein